jgi:hypothetical protein
LHRTNPLPFIFNGIPSRSSPQMSRGRSEGKKRQHSQLPPPPSQLTQSHLEGPGQMRRSQSSDGEDSIRQTRSAKRSRKSSPARVKSAALAKVMKKSSSSKGMAGFSALLNSTKLSAASTESTRGRNSRSSSGRAHAVGSNAEMVWTYNFYLTTVLIWLFILGCSLFDWYDCVYWGWH